ncbi:ISAs1 family transposase [Streptomyces sp. CB02959]|uniref:ISAs1 family transposase n=1 Tax=Streptomyces sp. CB02959 TaxID=2020330 RepID=UPI0027E3C483|nr:ISAs1 family transposase [Streptomyces sp. CB02959]
MSSACHRLPDQVARSGGHCGFSLVERLPLLPDPRRRRAVGHPCVAVLLVAASAVVSGARSYTAVGQWSANAPQHALADLTGADPAGSDSVALDGKAARGSRHGQTPAAQLPAAMTGDGRTVTQLRVPDKTNEITCFAALLAPFDLTGVTVTADALHTQRAHARFLVDEKKAHYLLVVKANQPELHRRLRSLPWKDVTARRYDREIGHGRRETRVTRALTVTDLGLDFPHAAQAVRILRHRTDRTTGTVSRQTVYAITDLTSHQASPQRLGQLARSQRTIENRFHFVRDTTFAEDASKIRTGHGPENMSTLRNLAINALHAAGLRNIAAGIRHVSYEPFTRPLDLLGIVRPARLQDHRTLQRPRGDTKALRDLARIRKDSGDLSVVP